MRNRRVGQASLVRVGLFETADEEISTLRRSRALDEALERWKACRH